MKRMIIREIANCSATPLDQCEFQNKKVLRVWTILDEEKLYHQFNEDTGAPVTLNLQEARLFHGGNVFLEDRVHDWNIRGGSFHIYSRIAERGTPLDLLIEYEDIKTEC